MESTKLVKLLVDVTASDGSITLGEDSVVPVNSALSSYDVYLLEWMIPARDNSCMIPQQTRVRRYNCVQTDEKINIVKVSKKQMEKEREMREIDARPDRFFAHSGEKVRMLHDITATDGSVILYKGAIVPVNWLSASLTTYLLEWFVPAADGSGVKIPQQAWVSVHSCELVR